MDFLKGWNLVASSFLKQGRNSSSTEESTDKNEKANVDAQNKKEDIEEVIWTANDTGDIMDLMETALTNVKSKLLTKMKRNSSQLDQLDVVKKEEMEVERLEDFISSAQTNTMDVVGEINSVMQIIAEVTSDDLDFDVELDGNIPEINPSDTSVGKLLGNDQDSEAKENWQRLMRKLSTKRKKSIKRKSKRKESENTVCMNPQVWSSEHNDASDFDTIENDDEDCIPDDWKPDFIPSRDRLNKKSNQPDVIPVDVGEQYQEEVRMEEVPPRRRINSIPQSRRSENR